MITWPDTYQKVVKIIKPASICHISDQLFTKPFAKRGTNIAVIT